MRLQQIAISLGLLLFTSHAAAGAWRVDKAHSRVGFSVTHLGINTVHGVFKKFDATVEADDSGRLGRVSASVRVASVDTGVDKRDKHLRAEDVFNAAKFPTMAVVADRMTWSGQQFKGTASLTIKGTTKKVAFKGKLTGVRTIPSKNGAAEMRAGYRVTASVDRKAFGVTFGGFSEGLSMVGETVDIVLDVELVRSVDSAGAAEE